MADNGRETYGQSSGKEEKGSVENSKAKTRGKTDQAGPWEKRSDENVQTKYRGPKSTDQCPESDSRDFHWNKNF